MISKTSGSRADGPISSSMSTEDVAAAADATTACLLLLLLGARPDDKTCCCCCCTSCCTRVLLGPMAAALDATAPTVAAALEIAANCCTPQPATGRVFCLTGLCKAPHLLCICIAQGHRQQGYCSKRMSTPDRVDADERDRIDCFDSKRELSIQAILACMNRVQSCKP